MKKIKTNQRSHISIVHHSLSVNRSIFIWLLAVVLVSFMLKGQAFADDDDDDRKFAGLYVGVLGDEYPEPITLKLSKEGGTIAISELEPRPGYPFTERESASLGEWRRTGSDSIEVAFIQYRYGDFLCRGLDARRNDPPENCTLVAVVQLTIDDSGIFRGDGVIKIFNRSSLASPYEFSGIPIKLQKTSFDDLKEMDSHPFPQ